MDISVKNIDEYVNIQAFIAGVLFISTLFLIGTYIQSQVEIASDNITPLFTSIFTGLGFGHFLAKAIQENKDSLTSAYIGALLILTVIVVYYSGLQPVSGILIIMTMTVFLSHTSGLIDDNDSIKNLIEFLAGDISPFALYGLGIIRYLVPYLIAVGNFPTIIQRLLNPIPVILILLILISIYEYLKLRRQAIQIAENANYMYDLGREASITSSQEVDEE